VEARTDSRERELSPLNLLYHMLSSRVDPNSCDVVILDGHLDHGVLKQAIARALRCHPQLSSHVVHRGGKSFWRVPPDELPIDFRVQPLPKDTPGAVDAALVANIWNEPLPIASGRPIRFHLIETPRRSYLQTIHTHLYADATSCYTLTDHVAESYAAIVDGRPWQQGPVDVEDRGVRALLTRRLSTRERLMGKLGGAMLSLPDFLSEDGGLALPEGPPGPRAFARAVLDPRRTSGLVAAARERKSTLHSLVKLAFLRAADRFNRTRRGASRPLRVWDFFSLRQLAPPQAAGLYDCLAIIYPVTMDPRWSDTEALAAFKDQLQRLRGGEVIAHVERLQWLFDVFGPALPLEWLATAWPHIFKSNVFLTNPGVCPSRLEAFGGVPVVDYVTFPQLFHPARVMFVLSTFRDHLRILAIYDRSSFADDFTTALFEPFLAELGCLSAVDVGAGDPAAGFVASWNPASPESAPEPQADFSG